MSYDGPPPPPPLEPEEPSGPPQYQQYQQPQDQQFWGQPQPPGQMPNQMPGQPPGQMPGQMPGPVAGYGPTPPPASNQLALWSMISGIAAVPVSLLCFLGVIVAIAACVLGFVALSQIKATNNTQAGRGQAITGICLGAFSVVLLVGVFAAAIIFGAIAEPSSLGALG